MLSDRAYFSGLESFILENVDEKIRAAYVTLFNTENDDEFNLSIQRIDDFLERNAGANAKSLDDIIWSPEYVAMKENSTQTGQLLGDTFD